jgi:hypothetical protein
MKRPHNPATWCWILYAVPCAAFLGWTLAGHPPTDRLELAMWIYGFPSTALVLPLLSLVGRASATGPIAVCLVAGICNGGLLCLVTSLVRNAMRSGSERSTTMIDRRN